MDKKITFYTFLIIFITAIKIPLVLASQIGTNCTTNNNICATGLACTSAPAKNVGDVLEPKFNGLSAVSVYSALNRHKNATTPCIEGNGYSSCSDTVQSIFGNFSREIFDEEGQSGLDFMNSDCAGDPYCINNQDIFISDLTSEIKLYWDSKTANHGEDCNHFEECTSLSCGTDNKCSEIKVCACAEEGTKPEPGQRCCQTYDYTPGGDFSVNTHAPDADGYCQSLSIPKEPYIDYMITLADGGQCNIVEKHGLGISSVNQSLPDGFTLKDLIGRDFLILAALEFLTSRENGDLECLFPQRGDYKDRKFTKILHNDIHKKLLSSREAGILKYNELIAAIAENAEQEVPVLDFSTGETPVEDPPTTTKFIDGYKTALEGQVALLEFDREFFDKGFSDLLVTSDASAKSIAANIGESYKRIRFDNKWRRNELKEEGDADRFDCRGRNNIYGRRAFDRRIEVKGGTGYGSNDYFIDPLYLSDKKFKSIGNRELGRTNERGRKVSSETEIKTVLRSEFDDYVGIPGIQIPGLSVTDAEVLTALNDQVFDFAWELFRDYSYKNDGGGVWNLRSRHPVKNRINTFYPKIDAIIAEVGYYLTQIIQAREALITCLNNPDGDLPEDGAGNPGAGGVPPPAAEIPAGLEPITGEAVATGGSNIGIDSGQGFGGAAGFGVDVGAGTAGTGNLGGGSSIKSINAGGNLNANSGKLKALADKIRKATAKDLLNKQNIQKALPSQAAAIEEASKISSLGAIQNAKALFNSGKNSGAGFANLKGLGDSPITSATQSASDASLGMTGTSVDGSKDQRKMYIPNDDDGDRRGYQPLSEEESKLLSDAEKDASRFKPKDNDSLWTKVTKAYARVGIPRLFSSPNQKKPNTP